MKKIDGIWKANCIVINTPTVNYKVLDKIEKLLDKDKAEYKFIYKKEYVQ